MSDPHTCCADPFAGHSSVSPCASWVVSPCADALQSIRPTSDDGAMVKLPSYGPKLLVVMPFLDDPLKALRPAPITIITAPPAAGVTAPACAAALQIAESSVYSSVPHTSATSPCGGQSTVTRRPA